MLNVWASWCPPCLVEHPVITALAKSGLAPVVGLNYKDARQDALPWLKRNGDPYLLSVFDANGCKTQCTRERRWSKFQE